MKNREFSCSKVKNREHLHPADRLTPLSTCTITSALSDRGGSEYRGFKLFDQDDNICLIPEPTHRVHCIASWIAKYFGLSDFLRSIVTLCFFIRGNRSFAYWLRKKHRISFRACPFKEKVTNGRFGTLAFACYVLSCPLRGIPFLRWVLTFLQRNKRLIKYSHRRRRAYAYLMSLSNEEMGNIMEFMCAQYSIVNGVLRRLISFSRSIALRDNFSSFGQRLHVTCQRQPQLTSHIC